jgi:4-amino-4-deoxy-L-arabinose transferase-like glycosyltransferase
MPSTSITPLALKTDLSLGPAKVALALALALIGYRLTLGLFDRTELSTDEAQYWFWGQSFAFGAYSKPPLIGWITRLSTDLFGQSVAAVRVPAILFHAATAAVIFACARRLASAPAAALSALLYLVSPAVVLGSALMTTDTPLLLAASLALLAQLQLGEAQALAKRAPRAAVLLGLALGFGILAKHAMLFWLGGAVAAAAMAPMFRPGRSDLLIAGAVMLAVIALHLAWLAQHGFITVSHIQDIAKGAEASAWRPLRFVAEQFLVAGPFTFAAIWLARRDLPSAKPLLALVLVPLIIVLLQAVKGPVLANWAVLYLVPGAILAGTWLARHPRLALVAVGLGLAVSIAFPALKVFGTDLRLANDRPILARYLGHSDVARWVLATASGVEAQTIVARDRDLLADLEWFSTGTDLKIRAIPPAGLPAHHWEMAAAFDPSRDPEPLVLLRTGAPQPCPTAQEVARHKAPSGFGGGDTLVLYRLPDPACLLPQP